MREESRCKRDFVGSKPTGRTNYIINKKQIMILTLGPSNLQKEFKFLISEFVKDLGIFVSGGLDSAALLCLILTFLKNNERLNTTNVKCFTVQKNDGSMFYADKVVKSVSTFFNKNLIHNNYINNDESSILEGRVGLNTIIKIRKENPGWLYMGVNNMAPSNIRPFSQTLNIVYRLSPYYSSPFINLHKPQILDIFYKLNCVDIIKSTHSCTVDPDKHCGTCYSCAERKWAFDSLGKKDPFDIN